MKRTTLHSALFLLAAGAFALPLAASAEDTKTLYKCVNAKGVSAIQSKPCPAGSTEAWKRAAESEPKPTAQEVAAARAREAHNEQQVKELTVEVQRKLDAQQPPPTVVGATTATTATTDIAPAPAAELPAVVYDNCQAAKAFATSVQEKTWIGLTDDQTRRVFGWVADQCRVIAKPED
jgi:hypothetical protein